MKKYKNSLSSFLTGCCFSVLMLLVISAGNASAQDSVQAPVKKIVKPVKSTFGSVWLMDNQTIMVPIKGTFEMDIQHRFGTVNKGSKDLWGLYAPSNIRLGFSYAPINKLNIGAGLTKERLQFDFNVKYALLQQTPNNKIPVSVTYFGNIMIDGRSGSNFRYDVHRLSYFHQAMIARKITSKFSAQVAPSLSWFNNVEGYVDSKGEIQKKMNNAHFAVSFLGRYKISDNTAIIAGLDQPLTQHPTNNPHPNISFGLEMTTSAHAFQVFAGNYYGIVPQSNNMFNQNDYTKGQFLIGFNITRLWNY